jgi:hypothetical protein
MEASSVACWLRMRVEVVEMGGGMLHEAIRL